MESPIRVAILTISDRSFRGEREDLGGPAVERALVRIPAPTVVVERTVLPDQRDDIAWNLGRIADGDVADLVLTTGGTGLGPRDSTPQGTLDAADYEVPGIGEAMRAAIRAAVPEADLSRATAAVRKRTLVVNLPGSPRGAVECLDVVARLLPHAIATLRGEDHVPVAGLSA